MLTFYKKLFNPLIINIGKKIETKTFSREPIIIGACPRSGTTLLLSILDAHPNIYAIQRQTYAFDRWRYDIDKYLPTRLDRLYREFIIHKIPISVTRWCEKTPKNIKSFEKILDYLPDAKLIHVVRDGRDVVTSKHPKHTPDEYWVSINRWIDDVKLGLKFKDHPNVLTIHYEHLINSYKTEMEKICTFINEDFVVEFDNWIENTTLKKSKHWAKKVQKLHSRSIARWKKKEYKNRVEEFMNNEQAVTLLRRLEYI